MALHTLQTRYDLLVQLLENETMEGTRRRRDAMREEGGEGSSKRFSLNALAAAILDCFKGWTYLDLNISESQLYWYTMISLTFREKTLLSDG